MSYVDDDGDYTEPWERPDDYNVWEEEQIARDLSMEDVGQVVDEDLQEYYDAGYPAEDESNESDFEPGDPGIS
jgi:hypothetical protein